MEKKTSANKTDTAIDANCNVALDQTNPSGIVDEFQLRIYGILIGDEAEKMDRFRMQLIRDYINRFDSLKPTYEVKTVKDEGAEFLQVFFWFNKPILIRNVSDAKVWFDRYYDFWGDGFRLLAMDLTYNGIGIIEALWDNECPYVLCDPVEDSLLYPEFTPPTYTSQNTVQR